MNTARLAILLATLATGGCELRHTLALPEKPIREGQCARGQAFIRNEMSAERRLAITDGLRAQGCGVD